MKIGKIKIPALLRDFSDRLGEPKTNAAVLEFQPDIVEIEQRPSPKAAEWTVRTIVAAIVFAILWATFAHFDRIVVAQGRLVTTSGTMPVQPLETGVVRDIPVRVGQAVKKGEVLAVLDPTFAEADTAASRGSLTSLDAQIARLEAQIDGRAAEHFSSDPKEDQLQQEIFRRHAAEVTASLASLDAEIGELTAEMGTNRQELESARKTLTITRQVEQMRTTLIERNAGSLLQQLEAKAQRQAAERDVDKLGNTAKEIAQKLNATRERRAAYVGEDQSKLAQELQQARRDRDKVAEDLKKQQRRASLVQLVAPEDAVVLEVANLSPGSVARQAEPLVTLVPADATLEAEVDVLPQDVALVRPGDTVRIKLEALPYQRHGVVGGRLDVLGADVVKADKANGERQQLVYRARLELTDTHLRNVPADFRLIPGMTVSAEIKVGSRRVIAYFAYPLLRALDESFREP